VGCKDRFWSFCNPFYLVHPIVAKIKYVIVFDVIKLSKSNVIKCSKEKGLQKDQNLSLQPTKTGMQTGKGMQERL
jgi:hypothetical protein